MLGFLFWTFTILAIVSLLLGAFFQALDRGVRKASAKEYAESLPEQGRNRVFLSYRRQSRSLAEGVRLALEQAGFFVVMWQPDDPWTDPVVTIIDSVDSASAVVAVRPHEMSVWVEAEHRLAAACKTSVIEVHSEQDLDLLIGRVAKAVARARPFKFALWERADLANTVFGQIKGFDGSGLEPDLEHDPLGIMKMFRFPSPRLYGMAVCFGLVAALLRACR
jgi:hypothetical protein